MTALAHLVAWVFVLAFLAAPFALCIVAANDRRKSWRRFGAALKDTRR